MLRLLLISLLTPISLALKAISFGETSSAATLFPHPSSAPADPDLLHHNKTDAKSPSTEGSAWDGVDSAEPDYADHAFTRKEFHMDDHFHNKPGDAWGLYVPVNLKSDTTVVRKAVGVHRRGKPRGTVQMDCKKTPEVCKNAGYYQNCIRGAKGKVGVVPYFNGPYEEDVGGKEQAAENRVNSGVTTSFSTPCRAWPFAQRFWHPQDHGGYISQNGLQTDEWPMATMQTGIFGTVPPISLRCLSNSQNSAGSAQVINFRRPDGQNYRDKGKWKKYRPGDSSPLALGDSYFVAFNFDSFPKQGQKHYAKWQKIRSQLNYAEWKQDSDCENDGLQFQMSALRLTDKGASGMMGAPYDSKLHNTYRLNDKEGSIKQFHVTLTVTDKAQDQVDARVRHMYGGSWVTLAQKAEAVKPGSSFTLKGSLPKALTIERQNNGCDYTFEYAKKSDGLRWFKFSSTNSGYGRWKHTSKKEDAMETENYCDKSSSSKKTTLECSFPGW